MRRNVKTFVLPRLTRYSKFTEKNAVEVDGRRGRLYNLIIK